MEIVEAQAAVFDELLKVSKAQETKLKEEL